MLAERDKLRSFVNQACVLAGREPMFADDEPVAAPREFPLVTVLSKLTAAVGKMPISPDQFYQSTLAGAVRKFLEMRKLAGLGPASAEEIHDGLSRGGFMFPSKDVENQKRGLQVSLSKNTQTFARLPNDLFGLVDWYK